jgi:aminoglycoside phosphotransferase (APT) family kinase protein
VDVTIDALAAVVSDGDPSLLDDITERSGGFDNRLFAVRRTHGEGASLIARVTDRRNASDFVQRSAAVHNWLRGRGYPVPMVVDWGSLEGGAYLLLEYVHAPPSVVQLARPWRWQTYVERFVSLHSKLHGLETAGWPGEVRSLNDVLASVTANQASHPLVPRLVEWLHDYEDLAGVSSREVVAHFDFHPINVLWDGRGDMVVLDWDNASLGSATADVAATIELVSLASAVAPNRLSARVVGALASSLSGRMLREYRRRGRVDDDALRYWRVVQLANAAIWSAGTEHLGSRVRMELAAQSSNWSLDRLIQNRFAKLAGEPSRT